MKPMSMRRFGQIVAQVMETLPTEFHQYLDNVVVDVEDEPSEEFLREQGFTEEEIAAGDSLYGIFVPMKLPIPEGGLANLSDLPARIIIYKLPLEEDFPNRRDFLIEIRKTVVHELAHHFGYSERDLEQFDDNPNPFGNEPDSADDKA